MGYIRGIAVDNNSIWFFDEIGRVLIECSKDMSIINSICIPSDISGTFSCGVVVGNKVFFAPKTLNSILCFDKLREELIFLPLDEAAKKKPALFDSILNVGDKIFALPMHFDYLVEINAETCNVNYRVKDALLDCSIRYGCIYDENRLALSDGNSDLFFLYDIRNMSIEKHSVQSRDERLGDICADKENIYILSGNSPSMYLIDFKTFSVKKKLDLSQYGGCYRKVIDCGTYLLVLQGDMGETVCIEKDGLHISSTELFRDMECTDHSIRYAGQFDNESVWLVGRGKDNNKLGIWDIKKRCAQWITLPNPLEYRNIGMNIYSSFKEEEGFPLSDFVNCLCQR